MIASLFGFWPGFIPFSHDSVPHTMSGLRQCSAVSNSGFLSLILLQFTAIILRFFFGGMSYGLLDLADLEHSDDLSEKFLVCWLEFGLLVLIGLNTERIESNVRIYLMFLVHSFEM